MSAKFLTAKTHVQCAHKGDGCVVPKNTFVTIEGDPILIEADAHIVQNCPNPPAQGGPCAYIVWVKGSSVATIQGSRVLLSSSEGRCLLTPVELAVHQANPGSVVGVGKAKILDAGLDAIQSLVTGE